LGVKTWTRCQPEDDVLNSHCNVVVFVPAS
jgi:hypothetical protein